MKTQRPLPQNSDLLVFESSTPKNISESPKNASPTHPSPPSNPPPSPLTPPTPRSSRQHRNFTTSASILNPNDADKKSSLMDRDSINTESNEYSKTGSDDSAAGHEDPAFQPGNNDPESQLEDSGPGDGRDPLKVSPANHEVSQPKMDTERGAQKGPERTETSGKGSGPKGGKVG
ncbi:hypothetical protein EPUS_09012 [Endocarpon pusillum Z07020]|uniref:Uncharacterized protein n=1 Tax=Endocarpon pusillum (strain Z07020 / HMAS-L-300199) TaxID=1263415 RepID=U1GWR4_ENDPU|nr:uncharacterized protein EPUS_09012 [Endocarpon pusillum Z07020]ERF76531.1 hypothetical protein EPUS_09012 [Endocarpon pusillum Z07020]